MSDSNKDKYKHETITSDIVSTGVFCISTSG